MAKFLGDSLVVEFGTVDISGKYTAYEVAEEAPEANRVDVSDKSSTEIETLEGLRGEPKATVTVDINDETDAASAALDLALNDEDTLLIYPEGKTHTKPLRTLNNAILGSRNHTGGYQSKMAWKLTFYSYETITDSTYSTA